MSRVTLRYATSRADLWDWPGSSFFVSAPSELSSRRVRQREHAKGRDGERARFWDLCASGIRNGSCWNRRDGAQLPLPVEEVGAVAVCVLVGVPELPGSEVQLPKDQIVG